ncbi:hypothetical protein HDU79_008771, partial [Rhizoclosmatium sp. JEL0117]
SDPWVNPFTSGVNTFEFKDPNVYWVLQSSDMSVQMSVVKAYNPNRLEYTYIADTVTFICAGSLSTTYNISYVQSLGKTDVMTCTSGSCNTNGNLCSLAVVYASDPVPNVSIQQIWYMGATAVGGLCYKDDSTCPTSSVFVDPAAVVVSLPSGSGTSSSSNGSSGSSSNLPVCWKTWYLKTDYSGYGSGSQVSYGGVNYVASYWAGGQPGTDAAWASKGACSSNKKRGNSGNSGSVIVRNKRSTREGNEL